MTLCKLLPSVALQSVSVEVPGISIGLYCSSWRCVVSESASVAVISHTLLADLALLGNTRRIFFRILRRILSIASFIMPPWPISTHTLIEQGMPENRRPPQTTPQNTPGLPGKPQTTTEHTAEHGRSGSKTAEEQCRLNYRHWWSSIGLLSHLLKCYDANYDALSN